MPIRPTRTKASKVLPVASNPLSNPFTASNTHNLSSVRSNDGASNEDDSSSSSSRGSNSSSSTGIRSGRKRTSVASGPAIFSESGKRLLPAVPGDVHCPSPIKNDQATLEQAHKANEETEAQRLQRADLLSKVLSVKPNTSLAGIAESAAEGSDADTTPRAPTNPHRRLPSLSSLCLGSDTLDGTPSKAPVRRSHSRTSSHSSFKSSFSDSSSRVPSIEGEQTLEAGLAELGEALGVEDALDLHINAKVPEASVLGWKTCPVIGCQHKFPGTSSKPLTRRIEHIKTAHPWLHMEIEKSA